MPKPKPSKSTKSTSKTKPASRRRDEDEGNQSLAELFNNTDAAEASSHPPEGEHVMRLSKAELTPPKKGKGILAYVYYEILDGEHEGKKGRQQYGLVNADGSKGQGFAYFKADLAKLEKDPEVKSEKDFKKIFEELSEEQPMCVVRVTSNGEFMNYRLQGLAEEGSGGGESSPEVEVGDEVEWVDDNGKTLKGEVLKIKEDSATIKDKKGKKHVVDLSDLSKEEAEGDGEGEVEFEVGDEVSFPDPSDADEKLTGIVTEIEEDGEHDLTVKVGKKEYIVEQTEATKEGGEGEGEGEAPEVEEGDMVKFKNPKDDDEVLEGKVTEIDGADITVKVGKKEYIIESDEIITDGEGDGEAEEIEVGDKVKFTDDGEEIEGKVLKIDDGTATVKCSDGVKRKVDVTDCEKDD